MAEFFSQRCLKQCLLFHRHFLKCDFGTLSIEGGSISPALKSEWSVTHLEPTECSGSKFQGQGPSPLSPEIPALGLLVTV